MILSASGILLLVETIFHSIRNVSTPAFIGKESKLLYLVLEGDIVQRLPGFSLQGTYTRLSLVRDEDSTSVEVLQAISYEVRRSSLYQIYTDEVWTKFLHECRFSTAAPKCKHQACILRWS